jgi:hypothetical protein
MQIRLREGIMPQIEPLTQRQHRGLLRLGFSIILWGSRLKFQYIFNIKYQTNEIHSHHIIGLFHQLQPT